MEIAKSVGNRSFAPDSAHINSRDRLFPFDPDLKPFRSAPALKEKIS
jgi:hypothetical protein